MDRTWTDDHEPDTATLDDLWVDLGGEG